MSSRLKSASSVRSANTLLASKGKKSDSSANVGKGKKAKKQQSKLEFPCAACERDGVVVEATSYCADCRENVCGDCVRQHQKYPVMKKHVIQDKPERREAEETNQPSYNPMECSLHPGQTVHMYCPSHDQLWCNACVTSKHENCTSSVVISAASKDIFDSTESQLITEDIRKIQEQLTSFRKLSEDNMERMVKLKTEIISQIKEYRSKIDKAIADIETATLQELENAYERGVIQNDTDRKSYNNLLDTFDHLLNTMLNSKDDPGKEDMIFIAIKRAKEKIQEGQRLIGYNKHTETSKPFNFVEDRRILDWIKSIHLMGTFSYQRKTYTATLLGNYPINHKTDSKACDVYGATISEDGNVLLTDWDNKCLKMLDRSYKLQQAFPLPGNPCGVCCINPEEAAVSLTKQKVIQFVSTRGEMALLHSIRTGEGCRGIDCHSGKLFVACGGFKDEGDAKINVYTLSGELVRVVERNNFGQRIFISPISMAISANARTYHVVDGERGIITMTYKNDVMSVFSGEDILWPSGICIDRNDNALVCNGISNNVVQICGINKVGAVVTAAKGVHRPNAIAFDANNMRLILAASGSKAVSVYQLDVEENTKILPDQEDIPPVTVSPTKQLQKSQRKTKDASSKSKDEQTKSHGRSKTQVKFKDVRSPKTQTNKQTTKSQTNTIQKTDEVKINGTITTNDNTGEVHINDDVVNAISQMLLSGKPTKPADLKSSLQKALVSEKTKHENLKATKLEKEKKVPDDTTNKTKDNGGFKTETDGKFEKEKTMTSNVKSSKPERVLTKTS